MAEAAVGSQTLNENNAKSLFAVLALNAAAFYLVEHAMAITVGDWIALATGWMSALPAGVGVVLTGILNAQIGDELKARMVFLRWRFPYPGSEAFSRYGPRDPRVDMAALSTAFGPLPTERKEQNALWYRLYRTIASHPVIEHVHRKFLFARDYSFISLILVVILGAAAAVTMPIKTAAIYVIVLVLQWALATRAANVSGHRFVTTVLAQKGAGN
ncbi:MAG: hypothetical protein WDM86_18790 [Rhizomicrobium sp.]